MKLPLAAATALLVLLVSTPGASGQTKSPAFPGPAQPAGPGSVVSAGGGRAVTGEVIVRYRPGTSAAARRDARGNANAARARGLRLERTELVTIDRGRSVAAALAALRRDPTVEFAEPNHLRYLSAFIPNDGNWDRMWGLHNTGQRVDGVATATVDADIDAPEAWDLERGKASTIVAVVDTGIKASHSDLDDNVISGWDFVDGDGNPQDLDGHGTHVAGTIGAEGHNAFGTTGVAHDVSLLPLRVFGVDGATTDAIIVDAFQYAASRGAKVVNASLGGPGGGAALEAVVRDNPGVLYVVAAGNGGADGVGDNNDVTPEYPCNVTQPNLICVAATDQNDRRAGFSNFGTTSVDLAAPGTEIWSTWPAITELYRDTFEFSPLPYATGGTNNTWGYQQSTALNWTPGGSWVLADSPSGGYAPNTDSWAQRNVVSLSGLSNCALGFRGNLVTEPNYDHLIVEASSGGGVWTELARYSSYSAAQIERILAEDFDLGAYGGRSEFWLRFRLKSDGDNSSLSGDPALDGAFVDEVVLKCTNSSGQHIKGIQGTSMATPHVAGAAALLYSLKPTLTPTQVKAAILDNGDPNAFVPTVSGRRLNAYGALLEFVAPSTTITSTPPAVTASQTASFQFTDDQIGSSYECMLDYGSWAPCSSGKTYTGLAHGSHTFRVRAINRSGTVDPTQETYTWIVDLQAPDTSINAKPAAVTNQTSASFTYTSNETGATFQCSLDAQSYASCPSSGTSHSGLTAGQHTFRVRSVDGAGNVDGTPATHTWTVDTTEPDTAISGGPDGLTGDAGPSFAFSSEAGATFECRLDAGSWAACTSPKGYAGLADGPHEFAVRARDVAGNLETSPAARSFTVDTTAPETVIDSGPSGTSTDASPSFAFSSEPGATFACRMDAGDWESCTSPKAYAGLAAGAHRFEVRAADAAGNADPSPAGREFTVEAVSPPQPEPTPTPTPAASPTPAPSPTPAASPAASPTPGPAPGGAATPAPPADGPRTLLSLSSAVLVDPDSNDHGRSAPGVHLERRRASIGTLYALEDLKAVVTLKARLPKRGRTAAASARRTVRLGRARVKLARGQSKPVAVRLKRKARKRLGRARTLKVTAKLKLVSLATGEVTRARHRTTLSVVRR